MSAKTPFVFSLGAAFFGLAVILTACARLMGRLELFFIALPLFFLSAICFIGPICGLVSSAINGLLYPRSRLSAPAKRVAAAEALLKKHDYAGACEAFSELLKTAPGDLALGISMTKALLACKGDAGRKECCGILEAQLSSAAKAAPGGSDAVLLLADLLSEEGRKKDAARIVAEELRKGYCSSERKLLERRMASLNNSLEA